MKETVGGRLTLPRRGGKSLSYRVPRETESPPPPSPQLQDERLRRLEGALSEGQAREDAAVEAWVRKTGRLPPRKVRRQWQKQWRREAQRESRKAGRRRGSVRSRDPAKAAAFIASAMACLFIAMERHAIADAMKAAAFAGSLERTEPRLRPALRDSRWASRRHCFCHCRRTLRGGRRPVLRTHASTAASSRACPSDRAPSNRRRRSSWSCGEGGGGDSVSRGTRYDNDFPPRRGRVSLPPTVSFMLGASPQRDARFTFGNAQSFAFSLEKAHEIASAGGTRGSVSWRASRKRGSAGSWDPRPSAPCVEGTVVPLSPACSVSPPSPCTAGSCRSRRPRRASPVGGWPRRCASCWGPVGSPASPAFRPCPVNPCVPRRASGSSPAWSA